MFYGALKGRVDVLDLLQKAGSEIDLVDHNGETPIFYSLKSGSERALKWFVNKNVDLNKINTANKKLIQKAASKECKIAAAVDLLVEAGAEALPERDQKKGKKSKKQVGVRKDPSQSS